MASTLAERRNAAFGTGAPLFYEDPIEVVRGEDVWLFDTNGKRYLDMYNNVPCVGHCNPRVVEAMHAQASTLNVHSRYLHEGVVRYAERLQALHDERLSSIVFACSGTEAVEVAVNMIRARTGGQGIICTDATYHGNSTEIRKFSRLAGRDPAPGAEVRAIPYPQKFRPLDGAAADDVLKDRYLAKIDEAIAAFAAGGVPFAGMIMCSFCANEGLPDIPSGFMAAAVERVHAAGGLFIADEVQAGFARSGNWWGYETSGFVPDVAVMGKPMGNGLPLSGAIASAETVEAFRRTGYFNTFASSPLQAAVGSAVIDEIENRGLLGQVTDVGGYLKQQLISRAQSREAMGDVRGPGLFVGIDWIKDHETREPDPLEARRIVNGMKSRGFLFGAAGQFGNVLKLRPPITYTREHADLFLDAFDDYLNELYGA